MTTEQPFYCDKCNTTFYSIIPITECIRCSQKELSDLKAKYLKEGYESCLREVKARVESLKKYTPQGGNMPDTYFCEGHNECLDEIKSLINEI